MKTMTRRKFISTSAKGLAAVWVLSQLPQQLFAQLPEYMQGEVMRKDEAEKSAAIIAAVNERREENR